jgi:hypothetical protein
LRVVRDLVKAAAGGSPRALNVRSAVKSASARNPLHGGLWRRKIPPKLTAAAGEANCAASFALEIGRIRAPLAVIAKHVVVARRCRWPVERHRSRIACHRLERGASGNRVELGQRTRIVVALTRSYRATPIEAAAAQEVAPIATAAAAAVRGVSGAFAVQA